MTRPANVTTHNILDELQRIAKKNALPISKLYIDVNSVTTFAKISNSGLVEISDDTLDRYKEETSLRDSNIEFHQEYNIDIQSIYKNYPFNPLDS